MKKTVLYLTMLLSVLAYHADIHAAGSDALPVATAPMPPGASQPLQQGDAVVQKTTTIVLDDKAYDAAYTECSTKAESNIGDAYYEAFRSCMEARGFKEVSEESGE